MIVVETLDLDCIHSITVKYLNLKNCKVKFVFNLLKFFNTL